MNLRTDLAVEDIKSGTKETFDELEITKVIVDEENAKKYHKNEGIYYTIDTKVFKEENHEKIGKIEEAIRDILKTIYKEYNISKRDEIFVVGLGNDDITPDALGPMVINKIIVTKHLYTLDNLSDDFGIVSAIKPGVMGQTGIETSDVIASIIKKIKPKCVIVVDALASRSLKRVGSSIQISTAGISPGSGVKNKRKEISMKKLGIPVIAIGVPTVVDVKNIGNDLLEIMNVDREKSYLLEDNDDFDFMLTPKEIDQYITDLSDCLANGINMSIHNI
ncbi:MAG: GPR endopeptidase [Anaeroplasmataceae bacterium]